MPTAPAKRADAADASMVMIGVNEDQLDVSVLSSNGSCTTNSASPAMAYLTSWRLHLGARALTSTDHNVAEIALQVGYESEAAFSRAFKRHFRAPPARYRNAAQRP